MNVQVPHNYRPRPYQLPFWRAVESGYKRIIKVWHRRAGKDNSAMNFTATQVFEKPGIYYHMAPTTTQARKIIWDARMPLADGTLGLAPAYEYIFPKELYAKKANETEMKLQFKNGSIWQAVGSDNYNALVGGNVRGCVFSEYALADPNAWLYIQPMLEENDGWAIFCYTPRGTNHGYKLWEMAGKNPDTWFRQMLTNDDTGVFSKEQIARIWEEIRVSNGVDGANSIVNQEYFCDFFAAILGSYYGEWMTAAEKEGRICDLPYERRLPVYAAWDLGVGDSMVLWFYQLVNNWIHVIDYIEMNGVGYDTIAREIRGRGYNMAKHWLPHDVRQREQSSGLSREAILRSMDIGKIEVVPQSSVESGIAEARMILPICKFDRTKCERGISALKGYQKKWDDRLKIYSDRPLHDWASHGADGFRYLAQGHRLDHPIIIKPHSMGQVVIPKQDWSVF